KSICNNINSWKLYPRSQSQGTQIVDINEKE
ncbi:unnamed protein product, partial [Allacma fusca]